MNRYLAPLFALIFAAILYSPAFAQDGPDVFVPAGSKTYTVPLSTGTETGVLTVTVKDGNILSIGTDLPSVELGKAVRLAPAVHVIEKTDTFAAIENIPEFPAGEAGKVDIVETHARPYDSNWDTTTVDVVIRNNTDETVGPVTLSAEANSQDGEYLGEGDSIFGTYPDLLEPGQIAVGQVVFRGIELLDTDTVEVSVDDSWLAGIYVPLAIESWKHSSRAGKSITGIMTNPWEFPVDVENVHLLCFDGERIPENALMGGGDTSAESLKPGESAPFHFNSDCESFIISAIGTK